MELTYAEKKTIERALAILERNEDERAKRFAIENEVKTESRNLVYNGFARIGVGFTNWRHVLMGGSSDASATTLS